MKQNMRFLFFFFFSCVGLSGLSGRNSATKIEFRDAPVLFQEGGKTYQQVAVSFRSEKEGKIAFSYNGKAILDANVKEDDNYYLLTFPSVSKPQKKNIGVKVDNGKEINYQVILAPQKKWEVYFVQHSHTDIGYTRPQSEVLAEQMRYIDYALDYCDETDQLPDDAKFRWTCESAWVTREFLRTRPQSQIGRFKKRIGEGRIEVTGMYFNMAEIADENIMYDYFQPLKEFKNQEIPVRLAMQDDVNGIAWCVPDYLKNTGVKYLIMGINETRSILPFDIPTCFWWESPSGNRLLAFRADHYMTGNFYGLMGKGELDAARMLWHFGDIASKGYPFDKIGIQFSGYFTDNSPPSTNACEIVEQWNKKYISPKLRLATAGEFLEYVDKNYGQTLPVYRNAWLDWWTDGFGSSSRETAEIRKTQNLMQTDEGLFSMVSMLGGELKSELEEKLNQISESALFFDEHTSGADASISLPHSENTVKQWLMKGSYAWEAVKKTTLFNEEALARMSPYFEKAEYPVIYVVNSMGWIRDGHTVFYANSDIIPTNKSVSIIDLTSGKKVPLQIQAKRPDGAYWMLEVENIPAMGFKAYKVEVSDKDVAPETEVNTAILENRFYKIEIDKTTGSVRSLYDKDLHQELVDSSSPYNLGQFIKETSKERDNPSFVRTTVSKVRVESGYNGPIWESIRIKADLEGFVGASNDPEGLELVIRLYKNTKKIEFKLLSEKLIVTDPEALYVAFPFALPDSRIIFETIGGTLTPGGQLPGSSSDWNVAQNFVSVRGKTGQIVVVSNEVPLWQFCGFNMGKFERNFKPSNTWLYSWVMNNYWFTNFRAFQHGGFSWTYQITSTSDTTNTFATKFAWGERNPFAVRTFTKGAGELKSPVLETLKISGSPNVLLVNSRPVFEKKNTILLHLRELEGMSAEVNLETKIPGLTIKKISEVNIIGDKIGQDIQSIILKPYEVKFVEVVF